MSNEINQEGIIRGYIKLKSAIAEISVDKNNMLHFNGVDYSVPGNFQALKADVDARLAGKFRGGKSVFRPEGITVTRASYGLDSGVPMTFKEIADQLVSLKLARVIELQSDVMGHLRATYRQKTGTPLRQALEAIGLKSPGTVNSLDQEKIGTIAELCEMTIDELLEIPRISAINAAGLADVLEKVGYKANFTAQSIRTTQKYKDEMARRRRATRA